MPRCNPQGARNIAIYHRMRDIAQVLGDPNCDYTPEDRLFLSREQIKLAGHWRKLEALCAVGLMQPAYAPPHEQQEQR